VPNFGGVRYGKFKCLHTHCGARTTEQFLTALGLEPREVWREQTGAAPYDDLPPLSSYEEETQEGARRDTAGAENRPGMGRPRPGNGAAPGDLDGEEWPAPPPRVTSYPEIPPLDALRIDPADLDTARLTPQCVVESYLYADVAAFPGPGGTGKTTLFLFEVVHIVLGKPLYGLQVHTPGIVVLVTAEDRRELLIARLHRLMEAMDLDDEERAKVCAGVMIWDVTGTVCRLTELDKHGNVMLTGLADAIVEHFRDASAVVVGLDPVISFGAGERIVNDNEHSLILAARRIVRGLGCCVRLICHTGKQGARDGVIDQYAARGGSALADGARMVAVLRAWDADAEKDKLAPPPGLSFGADEQVIVLARPKLSYAQPLIWITRRGYAFQHLIATRRPDPEAEARARADQVRRYLIDQLASGARHTKRTLEDTGIMPQAKLRAALAALIASGRVISAPLPEELRHGGRQDYLHPVAPTSSTPEAASTSSLPYREKFGDEVEVTDFSPPAYHLVNEGQRGSNVVDEVAGGKAEERETGRL
jgi:RecA-family ATPase